MECWIECSSLDLTSCLVSFGSPPQQRSLVSTINDKTNTSRPTYKCPKLEIAFDAEFLTAPLAASSYSQIVLFDYFEFVQSRVDLGCLFRELSEYE